MRYFIKLTKASPSDEMDIYVDTQFIASVERTCKHETEPYSTIITLDIGSSAFIQCVETPDEIMKKLEQAYPKPEIIL